MNGAGSPLRQAERLRLEVTLMDEPCLWRWDIWDEAAPTLVQSSWNQEWVAYGSREDAERAGRQQVQSLIARHDRRGISGADAGRPE